MPSHKPSSQVEIISDIVNHYGFPQMSLAAINGYRRTAGHNAPPISVRFAGVPSFGVETAARFGAVLAREKVNPEGRVIVIVADPGVSNQGYVIRLKNGLTLVTPGNPKGIAASQIIHEAGGRDKIESVVSIDQEDLPDGHPAKYEHGWPTFPGLGLYAHLGGLLAGGVKTSNLGKKLTQKEVNKIPLLPPEVREPSRAEFNDQLAEMNDQSILNVDEKTRLAALINFMPEKTITPYPPIPLSHKVRSFHVDVQGQGTGIEPVVTNAISRHLGSNDFVIVPGHGTVRVNKFKNGPTVIEGNAELGSRMPRASNRIEHSFRSNQLLHTIVNDVVTATLKNRSLNRVQSLTEERPSFIPEGVRLGEGFVEGKIVAPDSFGNITTNIYFDHLAHLNIDPFKLPKNGKKAILEYQTKGPNGNLTHHFYRVDLIPRFSEATTPGHMIMLPAGGDDGAMTLYRFLESAKGHLNERSEHSLLSGSDVRGKTVRIHSEHLASKLSGKSKSITIDDEKIPRSRIKVHF